MKIQILGTGCAKCNKLAEIAKKASDELKLNCELVKVTDLNEIAKFGVIVTPALAINGQVKISGKVPTIEEVKKLLQ